MTKGYWQRFEKQRISRRRLLVTSGAGAAGLALVAACGGGNGGNGGGNGTPPSGTVTASPTEPLGEPKRGGRYKGVNQGDWGTIDPVTSVGTATGILPRMYNTLFTRSNVDPEFIIFDLAESLEQVDEVTYVFQIRPGVKIGPNDLGIPERDMDAQDVMVWMERIGAEQDALPRVFTEPWVDSYDVTDTTYTMKTKGPYGYLMSRMGRALGGCIPPREFYEQGISLRGQGVGGGPFIIAKGGFEESGSIILDRNPNYYRTDERTGEQLPYVDGIDVARITDRQARRTAFLDKQVYTYGAETADEMREITRQRPELTLRRSASFQFIAVSVNPTRDPWKDDRIREALRYALNRKQFIDLIVGEGEGRPNGLVHWPTGPFAFNEEELEEFQPHDPQKSRELIRAATGQDTIKVPFFYPISDIQFLDKHLPIFLQQMREAGFEVQEEPRDFGSWLADYTNVNYDASLSLNQVYETPEIALDWHSSKGPQGDGNFATGVGALYPEIDEALLDSKRPIELEEHVQAVRDVQKLIYEKGPAFFPIFSWYSYSLYWDFVKNLPQPLGDTGDFVNTWWLDV